MISLLIVDDEVELLEGIKSVINWEEHDIYICGETDNGASALQLINNLSPQIVLMDIRMPVMDGLKVLGEIYKNNINTKCIILSGYDDFYYAQKAINFKASDYLLKPCKPEDILESVLKVKKLIEEETCKEGLLNKYKKHFYENIPVLKEKLLREILYNKTSNYSNLPEKLDLYKVKINNANIVVILFCINFSSTKGIPCDEIHIEALKIAASDIINNSIPQDFCREIFQDDKYLVTILSYENSNEWSTLLNSILPEVKVALKNTIQISTTIGVGKPVKDMNFIWKSYKEALAAVETKFFIGEDNIIYFEEIAIEALQNSPYPIVEDIEIINCLATNNNIDLKDKVNKFFNALYCSSAISKDNVQHSCFALLGSILRFCLERNINVNSIFDSKLTCFNELQKCETAIQLQEKLLKIINTIFNKINEDNDTNHLIKNAIEYIKENYNEDINLETVSKNIFITPGYLSLLFKQETGINFLDYLHKYRIQKAKEFFRNRFLKNYEVSRMVGYNDEKYFSQMFKRYTGLTPTQYKDSIS